MTRRIASVFVAMAMARPAAAARQLEPEASEQASSEDGVAEARQAFERGRTYYETADYARAIEAWTEAYGKTPSEPEYAQVKGEILFNLASAHEKAFAVNGKPEHIHQALLLLDNFEAQLEDIYSDETERADNLRQVQAKRVALQAKLEAKPVAAEPEAAKPAPAAAPASDKPSTRAGRPLIISGGVLLGVGVLGLGLMAGGMVMAKNASDLSETDFAKRRDQIDQGITGNALSVTGAVLGSVALVAGAVLLALGLKKKTTALAGLQPGLGGVSWHVAF